MHALQTQHGSQMELLRIDIAHLAANAVALIIRFYLTQRVLQASQFRFIAAHPVLGFIDLQARIKVAHKTLIANLSLAYLRTELRPRHTRAPSIHRGAKMRNTYVPTLLVSLCQGLHADFSAVFGISGQPNLRNTIRSI
jgi:hypothetical protein